MQLHEFGAVDYIVFILTIVVSLGIGIYYALSGGRQRTTSEYLVGNRKMAVLPVAISLLVSFESSIMMLGTPAEIYRYGIQWIWANLGFFCANLLAIKVMVPLIHPLKITSANEYLELRFKSHAVRLLATSLGILNYVMYMGIVLFGPALALEAVTGFPMPYSILIVALAAVIYTSIGGIKAVIWTDVFQFMVMFSGIFAVMIKGTIDIGGIGKTWKIANENGRLNWFNFDLDPRARHTFWNLFIGSVVRGLFLIFNQSSVQRISSTPTLSDAKKVMYYTAPGFLVTIFLAVIEGIIAYSYYHTIRCDPLASKTIKNSNQIVPAMVMSIFGDIPGMPGLFIASLFSASLSTLSSGLSSLSALVWQDFVRPHTKPMSEFKATVIAKLSVVVFGCMAVAVAFLVSTIGGTLVQITGTILSTIGGPLTGVYLIGCFCPWVNAKGAIFSCISGVAIVGWIATGMSVSTGIKRTPPLPPAPTDKCFDPSFVANASDWMMNSTLETMYSTIMTTEASVLVEPVEPKGLDQLYSISYTLLSIIGLINSVISGTIFSFLTGYTKPEESDPRYLISLTDELLFFLPEWIRKPLRFGYNYDRAKAYKEKEFTEIDLVSDKIHNFANVTITISSEKREKDKINGVGELLIEDPQLERVAADEDGTVTGVTLLVREKEDASNDNSGEEEASALLTKQEQM
ncbi:sodium-coupled monocarboxylate transporter 1-like isoform X1 [Ostrea edulis]|uniref:sodium-coupled monocarboxylate transporter 1-like isoform X1 n=2 Tax=Ostrea edulis TaxID=37623 RepID=UPI0024AFE86F|nr:sodium-coupled monocarboxylate transporter 1-like isoform X1 [Ostrea edulis]